MPSVASQSTDRKSCTISTLRYNIQPHDYPLVL
jgi:hypothetical protein